MAATPGRAPPAPAGPPRRQWLMLVTDRNLTGPARLLEAVVAAVEGGVDLVQVREKDLPEPELAELVRALVSRVGQRAAVLVNGRPQLAAALGVGLHLPEPQPPPDRPPSLWGRSVHGPQGAALAAIQRPAYLVAGPVFPTASKPQARPLGLQGLRAVVEAARGVPVLAIGGLQPQRVGDVLRAGARGVAVRAAILQAPDPAAVARAFRQALDDGTPS